MVIQRFRPTFTGHGIQIEAMAKELIARGARVEILTRSVEGAPEFEEGPVSVRRFAMTPTSNPIRLWWNHRPLLRYIHEARRDFDIVHLHGAPPGLPFVLGAAREAGLRTVITTTLLGSDDPLTLRGLGRLARWRFNAYRSADRFVAICPALADLFPRAGIDPERVRHIPVGVSVERFHPAGDREAAAAELEWPVGVPRALFVGAVLKRKGVDVLLNAWERVLVELPDARLFIAGPLTLPGPGETEAAAFAEVCRARAERPPLAGRVQFLGSRNDVPALYRAAHLFLFPSRIEGFPNVLLESLASGTPPVTARIPGSTDVSVRDGETGFVVEQEDATALAARAVELLRDPALLKRFALAGRADAERRYAMPVIADAHLALYGELLHDKGGR
jgi:glycosyltransferase involved in cell wall biosynthesis